MHCLGREVLIQMVHIYFVSLSVATLADAGHGVTVYARPSLRQRLPQCVINPHSALKSPRLRKNSHSASTFPTVF